jgi:REP element-mobilizing transposase RayT
MSMRRRAGGKAKQLELGLKFWGGKRKGAGRKPKSGVAGVDHRPRGPLSKNHPAHVTMKLRSGLPVLRRKAEYAALRTAFTKGKERFGLRLVHYVVLNDHIHMIVEAQNRDSLRTGVQGLAIRIARALNKLWKRKGRVFADRYHDHVLTTPREVKNALAYVMHNARHHAAEGRMVSAPHPMDQFSSGPWFDGWREHFTVRGIDVTIRPIADAKTWLLSTGWRRHGLLALAPPANTG